MSQSEADGDVPGTDDDDICRIATSKALQKGLSDEYCGDGQDQTAVLADTIADFDGVEAEELVEALQSRLDEEAEEVDAGDGDGEGEDEDDGEDEDEVAAPDAGGEEPLTAEEVADAAEEEEVEAGVDDDADDDADEE